MLLSGLFATASPLRKFLLLAGMVLTSTVIFSMLGGLITGALYGVDVLSDRNAMSNLGDPKVIAAMKLLQLITTGIGMFVVPSLLAAWMFHRQPLSYLSLSSRPLIRGIILTVFLMFAAVPLINVMIVVNEGMQLPAFLSGIEDWMKQSEAHAAEITEKFLLMNSVDDLWYNLLIVALVPAIGEELLFRGVLMRLFHEVTRNIHATVWISAAIFSAIHLQFYGFLPRMFLGILFGYLLVWSGSLWLPVIAHFINNGAAVVFAWYHSQNRLPFDENTIGTTGDEWYYALISALLVSGIFIMIRKSAAGTAGYSLLPSNTDQEPVSLQEKEF